MPQIRDGHRRRYLRIYGLNFREELIYLAAQTLCLAV